MARFLIVLTLILCFCFSSTVKAEAQSQTDPREGSKSLLFFFSFYFLIFLRAAFYAHVILLTVLISHQAIIRRFFGIRNTENVSFKLSFSSNSGFFYLVEKKSAQEDIRVLNAKIVEVLKEILIQLGKKDWNFSIDPCINDTNWFTQTSDKLTLYNNTVICNCSNPDGFCHVNVYLVNYLLVYHKKIGRKCIA
ncbi:unnamed protein product [Malus baccata var. baccata]